MRRNELRAALASGRAAFGTMIQEIRTPAIAYVLADAGLDFVFLDMEHSTFSIETASDLIKTIRLTGLTCLVRASDNQYHLIARMLDAGAEGIMVPRVETRGQVEAFVASAKYPPTGRRGLSVAKGHNDYRIEDSLAFSRQANQENLTIVQIESQRAVEDIDEIVSVPGVDVAVIGPQDLSVSYGVPMDTSAPVLREAIGRVVTACEQHHVISGMHIGDISALAAWHRQGMRLLTYSHDLEMLRSAYVRGLASLREAVAS